MNLTRGFSYVLIARIVTVVVYVLITPFLVRFLGVEYGEFAFVDSMLALMVVFLDGIVFDGLRKYLAEKGRGSGWRDDVFGFYVRVTSFGTSVLIAVILLTIQTGLITSVLGPGFETYFYLLVLMVFVRQFFYIIRSSLMGFGCEHISEPLEAAHRVIFGLLGVTLAFFGWGVAGVLLADVIAVALVSVVGTVFVSRRIDLRTVGTLAPVSFPRRELLTFNSYNVLLQFLVISLYHIDILMLQVLAGTEQTAYYKAALVVAEFLWMVPIALQTTLVHHMSELWSEEDIDLINEIVTKITRYTLLLLLLLAIGIATLADRFVRLYFGVEFEPAVTPLLILLPGALGYAVARPIIAVGIGKGELRVLVIATGGAAVINLVLNAILIPRAGMFGAAIATSIGYGSMLAFHLIGANRVGFEPLGDIRLGRVFLTVGVTVPVLLALDSTIESTLLALAVVPPVGLVVYTAVAFKIGAIDRAEVTSLVGRLPIPARIRTLLGS